MISSSWAGAVCRIIAGAVALSMLSACGSEPSPAATTPTTPTVPTSPASSVPVVRIGDTLTRTIPAGTSADTVKVRVTAGRPLRALLSFLDLDYQTPTLFDLLQFVAYDSATGGRIAANIASGIANPTRGSFPFEGGRTYYIVTTKSSFANPSLPARSYRVALSGGDPAPEHASSQLAFGDSASESIDSPNDVDEFTLIIPRGTKGQLMLRSLLPNPTDTILAEFPGYTLSPSGIGTQAALDVGTDTRRFGSLSYTFVGSASTDTITVRVRGLRDNTVGPYRLTLFKYDPAPEGVSSVLRVGDTLTSAIEFPGDVDTFTFTGEAGKHYALAAQNANGRANDKLRFLLTGGSGPGDGIYFNRFLDGTTTTLLGQMGSRFAGGAPVTLQVYTDGDPQASGAYRIAVIPIDTAPEHAPPVLTTGDTVSDAIELGADIDQYIANATAGDTLIVYYQTFDPDTEKRLSITTQGVEYGSTTFGGNTTTGLPLLGHHTNWFFAAKTGPFTINVTGDGGSKPFTGAYRIVLSKITSKPTSVSTLLPINRVVTVSGNQPGKADHFTFTTTPGQQIAAYVSAVPGSGTLVGANLTVTFPPFNGVTGDDSLGVGGSDLVKVDNGQGSLDVVMDNKTGSLASYRVWLYPVNRGIETVASTIHVGDNITQEVIYPAADIDDFTLVASAGTRFKACIATTEPPHGVQGPVFQLFVRLLSGETGFVNTFEPTGPHCTGTMTMSVSGSGTVEVVEPYRVGGRYQLSIVAVP